MRTTSRGRQQSKKNDDEQVTSLPSPYRIRRSWRRRTCRRVLKWAIVVILVVSGLSWLVDAYFYTVGPRPILEPLMTSPRTNWPTNPTGQKFTIIVPTFKRLDLIKKFVHLHVQCPNVDAIYILWQDMESDPPNAESFFKLPQSGVSPRVLFHKYEQNDLNNRFIPPPGLATDAVFAVDDDMLIPCYHLTQAFETWIGAPDSLVGFAPRVHTYNPKIDKYVYYKRAWVYYEGIFSLMLTKACFVHRKYLELYTNDPALAAIKEQVHQQSNCEDVLMNFVVANSTFPAAPPPPIWVHAHVVDQGGTVFAISNKAGHYVKRSECLEMFVRYFGRMPLTYSTLKTVSARRWGLTYWLRNYYSSV